MQTQINFMLTSESPAFDPLLHKLAKGDMSVLDQIYDRYRNDFLHWTKSQFSTVNRDDILDAWHDTMIMFYEQVRDAKLTHLTCELRSFLFLIGYRRMLKMHKKAKKIELLADFTDSNKEKDSISSFDLEEIPETQRQVLLAAVKELPDQSRQILMQRFIKGKSIEEIRMQMNYKSTNAISVTLCRALKRLNATIANKMNSIQ